MSILSEQLRKAIRQQGLNLIGNNIEVVNQVAFRGPCNIYDYCFLERCKIDAFSGINRYTKCVTSSVGRFCSIGENVRMGLTNQAEKEVATSNIFSKQNPFAFAGYNLDCLSTFNQERQGECTYNVTVGHDVWIGSNAIFTSDVKVGNGAVVGAGAVVSEDVPPYAIVVGKNKILRYRFSDELIADILDIQWWEYNVPAMMMKGVQLNIEDPAEFVAQFKDLAPEQLISFDDKWKLLSVPNSEKVFNTTENLSLKIINGDFDLYYNPRAKA